MPTTAASCGRRPRSRRRSSLPWGTVSVGSASVVVSSVRRRAGVLVAQRLGRHQRRGQRRDPEQDQHHDQQAAGSHQRLFPRFGGEPGGISRSQRYGGAPARGCAGRRCWPSVTVSDLRSRTDSRPRPARRAPRSRLALLAADRARGTARRALGWAAAAGGFLLAAALREPGGNGPRRRQAGGACSASTSGPAVGARAAAGARRGRALGSRPDRPPRLVGARRGPIPLRALPRKRALRSPACSQLT